MDGVIVAVIGSFIGAGAGFVIDTKRQKSRLEKITSSLKVDISCDLERSVELYDRLLKEWQTADPAWLASLQLLRSSNPTYCSNQEWLGLFDRYGCKIQICDYYAASSQLFDRIDELYADLHSVIDGGVETPAFDQAKTALNIAISQLSDCRTQAEELLQALNIETVKAA